MFLFSPPDVEKLAAARNVKGLIRALRHKDNAVRRDAAKALGDIADARAVEPLCSALGDEIPLVGMNAAEALGKIGDVRSIEPLVHAFRYYGVNEKAGAALVEIGTSSVEPLILALKDQEAKVRIWSVRTLGKIHDSRAIVPLIGTFKTFDKVVYDDARDVVCQFGELSVEPLIEALKEKGARGSAAIMLGKIGDSRAVVPLIAALTDSDTFMRRDAAFALGAIGDPRAVEPLIVALKDQKDLVRQPVATALGELADPRAVEPLIAALKDDKDQVRQRAAAALCKVHDARAVEPLTAALVDYDTAPYAATALGEIRDRRAVGPLMLAFQAEPSSHSLREKANLALNALGEPVGTSYFVFDASEISTTTGDSNYGRYAQDLLAASIREMVEPAPIPEALSAKHGDLFDETYSGDKPRDVLKTWLKKGEYGANAQYCDETVGILCGEQRLPFVPYLIGIYVVSSIMRVLDQGLRQRKCVGYRGAIVFEQGWMLNTRENPLSLVDLKLMLRH